MEPATHEDVTEHKIWAERAENGELPKIAGLDRLISTADGRPPAMFIYAMVDPETCAGVGTMGLKGVRREADALLKVLDEYDSELHPVNEAVGQACAAIKHSQDVVGQLKRRVLWRSIQFIAVGVVVGLSIGWRLGG